MRRTASKASGVVLAREPVRFEGTNPLDEHFRVASSKGSNTKRWQFIFEASSGAVASFRSKRSCTTTETLGPPRVPTRFGSKPGDPSVRTKNIGDRRCSNEICLNERGRQMTEQRSSHARSTLQRPVSAHATEFLSSKTSLNCVTTSSTSSIKQDIKRLRQEMPMKP